MSEHDIASHRRWESSAANWLWSVIIVGAGLGAAVSWIAWRVLTYASGAPAADADLLMAALVGAGISLGYWTFAWGLWLTSQRPRPPEDDSR